MPFESTASGVSYFYYPTIPIPIKWGNFVGKKCHRGYFGHVVDLIKDTLWVLRRDEPLVHVSVDILLITKHILDHVISLES